MSKKQNEVMGSTGIRFSQDQLDRCDAKSRELGISRNEFVREAVEFYLEWLSRECTEKFLTPALESVFSAKLRDTEDRLARILFKMAVEQNVLARIILEDGHYVYEKDFVEQIRRHAVQHVKETNGKVSIVDLISNEDNPRWQD